MNEDLKWLAENVHEWKHSDCDLIRRHGMASFYYGESRDHLYPREQYYTREQWQAARDELAAQKQWRGPEDGLPSVGVGFEFSVNGRSWEDRVMLFNDGITCLMAHKQYPANRWHYKCDDPDIICRPLRTEEDKAVEEMLALDCDPCEGMLSREDFCRKLYEKGYRKQEPK